MGVLPKAVKHLGGPASLPLEWPLVGPVNPVQGFLRARAVQGLGLIRCRVWNVWNGIGKCDKRQNETEQPTETNASISVRLFASTAMF